MARFKSAWCEVRECACIVSTDQPLASLLRVTCGFSRMASPIGRFLTGRVT
jgi:hypothetical protein